jgi:hypothetical protein
MAAQSQPGQNNSQYTIFKKKLIKKKKRAGGLVEWFKV